MPICVEAPEMAAEQAVATAKRDNRSRRTVMGSIPVIGEKCLWVKEKWPIALTRTVAFGIVAGL